MNIKEVYLDNAATTPIEERVQKIIQPFIKEHFGNPSSFHSKGKFIKDSLLEARGKIANAIKSRPDEIFFTSGLAFPFTLLLFKEDT